MEKKALGNRGEHIASMYLQEQGYQIKEQNWFFRHREIDIIAEKDNLLIFIEVKTRTYPYLHNPLLSVNKKKQHFIMYAADHYIRRKKCLLEARFDIIVITFQHSDHAIEHIKDAFSVVG